MEHQNQEMNSWVSASICNQKGGIGKSTFTVLLASYLHYTAGYDVLVVDCDFPQWSIQAQRDRELEAVQHNDYYKLSMVRQFKQTGRKLWPIIRCMPTDVQEEIARYLSATGYCPQIILYDLPGTVNAGGILQILSSLDCLFVPVKADKVVLESALSFARAMHKMLVESSEVRLRGIYLFWTMIDRRERTPLFEQYETVIRKLGLPLLNTHIPYRSKFNKELLATGEGVGRSTILAPEQTFALEAQIEALAEEMLTILKIR